MTESLILPSLTLESLDDYRKWIREQLMPSLTLREILLLKGPMGVGKTQLVRYLVEELGGSEVCSPSFAIHNRYKVPSGNIDHIDLYRLEDEDDLESTGFWDFFIQPEGLILIEWADRLDESFLPPDWRVRSITIDFGPQGLESQKRYLQVQNY